MTDPEVIHLMVQARAAGRLAGEANRGHGTLPVPPASVTAGSLLSRRAAVQWYRGLAEGREADGHG